MPAGSRIEIRHECGWAIPRDFEIPSSYDAPWARLDFVDSRVQVIKSVWRLSRYWPFRPYDGPSIGFSGCRKRPRRGCRPLSIGHRSSREPGSTSTHTTGMVKGATMMRLYRIEIDVFLNDRMRTKLIEIARSDYEKSGGAWTEENGQRVKIPVDEIIGDTRTAFLERAESFFRTALPCVEPRAFRCGVVDDATDVKSPATARRTKCANAVQRAKKRVT
jgi:hypothetical protein